MHSAGQPAAVAGAVRPLKTTGRGGVMNHDVGVWTDHRKVVIGGEKKYEERHNQDLDRSYDDVIGQLGTPDALLLFGRVRVR